METRINTANCVKCRQWQTVCVLLLEISLQSRVDQFPWVLSMIKFRIRLHSLKAKVIHFIPVDAEFCHSQLRFFCYVIYDLLNGKVPINTGNWFDVRIFLQLRIQTYLFNLDKIYKWTWYWQRIHFPIKVDQC